VHALAHDLARLLHRVRVDRGAVAGLGLQDDLGAPLEVEGELGGWLPSALPDPGTDPAAQQQDQHGKGRQGYARCGNAARFGRSVHVRRAPTWSLTVWSAPRPPDVLVTRRVLGDGHAGDAVLGGAGVLGRGLVLRRLVLVHGRGDGLTCPLALRTVLALEDDD